MVSAIAAEEERCQGRADRWQRPMSAPILRHVRRDRLKLSLNIKSLTITLGLTSLLRCKFWESASGTSLGCLGWASRSVTSQCVNHPSSHMAEAEERGQAV